MSSPFIIPFNFQPSDNIVRVFATETYVIPAGKYAKVVPLGPFTLIGGHNFIYGQQYNITQATTAFSIDLSDCDNWQFQVIRTSGSGLFSIGWVGFNPAGQYISQVHAPGTGIASYAAEKYSIPSIANQSGTSTTPLFNPSLIEIRQFNGSYVAQVTWSKTKIPTSDIFVKSGQIIQNDALVILFPEIG